MNKVLYVLAADSGRAKLYRTETPFSGVTLLYDLVNFKARSRPSEIYSDRAGGHQNSHQGFRSYAGEKENHDDEVFAKNLCRILQTDHLAGKYDNLVLIASPHFLGEIRQQLSKACKKSLLKAIDKNPAQMRDEDILSHIHGNAS